MTTRAIPEIFYGRINEGESPRLLQRIEDETGTTLTQADVSSIAYAVYDTSDYTTAVASGSLTIADVVSDSLTTDDTEWNARVDATGYNFEWICPTANVPDGGTTYLIEVVLSLTDGTKVVLKFQIKVLETYSVT